MFRLHRRWFIVALSTVLPPASATLGLYLKVFADHVNYWVVGFIILCLGLLSFGVAYSVQIKPFRDLSSPLKLLLQIAGNRIIEKGAEDGIALRLNLLMLYRPFRGSFRLHFRIRWGLGMSYQPDGAVEFLSTKGVCGSVLASRRGRLIDMSIPANQEWGFNEKEKKKFPTFTAIWSLPVFELDKEEVMTGRILGTINLDSETPGAYQVLAGDPDYRVLFEEFRDVVSKVTS